MHSFHFRSCSRKVLIFFSNWNLSIDLESQFFFSLNVKFQLFNLGLSVCYAPESIGKWSGQQNRCPIPLKRYVIPGVQRKQMRHKTEIICILHVGHLVWRSQWPLFIRQLGDILMDCTMYLYIFQVLLCSGVISLYMYSQTCLTFFKDR